MIAIIIANILCELYILTRVIVSISNTSSIITPASPKSDNNNNNNTDMS